MQDRFPYTCPFLMKNGSICNNSCARQDGCCKHTGKKPYFKCEGLNCDKYTMSLYKKCTVCSVVDRDRSRRQREKERISPSPIIAFVPQDTPAVGPPPIIAFQPVAPYRRA